MCQCVLTRTGNTFCNKPLQKKAPDGLWWNCLLMLMGHQYSPNHFSVSILIEGQHRSCFLKLFSFFSHDWLPSTPVSLRNKAGLSFNDVFAWATEGLFRDWTRSQFQLSTHPRFVSFMLAFIFNRVSLSLSNQVNTKPWVSIWAI